MGGILPPLLLSVLAMPAGAAEQPLVLERAISLPDGRGRIDHMAIDPGRNRLIVADLGNDSVEVIDLATGKVLHRFGGLKEPQGAAYAQHGDAILVASGGDGTVRLFAAADFAPTASISLGDAADNVHIDAARAQRLPLCGDAADAFFDDRRQRIYASCGAGDVAVFEHAATGWARLAAVDTATGARSTVRAGAGPAVRCRARAYVGIGRRHRRLSAILMAGNRLAGLGVLRPGTSTCNLTFASN